MRYVLRNIRNIRDIFNVDKTVTIRSKIIYNSKAIEVYNHVNLYNAHYALSVRFIY